MKTCILLLSLIVAPALAGTIYEWKDPTTGKLMAGDKPPEGIKYWPEGKRPQPQPTENPKSESRNLGVPSYTPPPKSNDEKAKDSAQVLIRGAGFRCDTVDSVSPFLLSHGFTAHCNGYRYKYEIEDKGGRIIVTVK